MPKTWPLCISAKSNLRDRVLGETGKDRCIAFRQRGTQQALAPQNCVTVCANLEEFCEKFYSNCSRVRLLIRIREYAGPALL